MAGNPRYSRWYSTPVEDRVRRPLNLSVDAATRARLERLSVFHDASKSVVLELLVQDAERLQFDASAPAEVPRRGPLAPRAAAMLRAGIAGHCGRPDGPLQADWCSSCGAALVAARLLER